MDLKELMKTTPDNLAKNQFKELKKHTLDILKEVQKHIENEEFEKVDKMLHYSPAGDGYGDDNYYINFSYSDSAMDIQEIIDNLKYLKQASQKKGGKK